MVPIAYLTRTESFSAAHRLHSIRLTDEENYRLYGKCNHPNYHGHNYKVEITVRGPVDLDNGMVVNMTDLKEVIKEAVLDPLDHKNLDLDVPFFSVQPSTTENLAVFIWKNFKYFFDQHPVLKHSQAQIYKVRLQETEHNVVEFMGESTRER
ncbi:hypothetical protein VTP01DRAFT_4271 [Rhizomucor pusillus]|uniref:uncharacterized protein n=1 Tax=Rhizomucor pusillus TaxID=4840 RepID=UPI0037431C72